MAKLGIAGLLVLLLVCAADAQGHKSPTAKAGNVSGSVFLITRGGDLKPARMAHVYLFYVSPKAAESDESGTVGRFWLDKLENVMDEYEQEAAKEGLNWGESMTCRKRLATYPDALSQTLQWVSLTHKESEVIAADADENGTFNVAVPHPGKYVIVAIGHAGFNDAFWEIGIPDRIVVNAGATTTVKLSSPAQSCLVD